MSLDELDAVMESPLSLRQLIGGWSYGSPYLEGVEDYGSVGLDAGEDAATRDRGPLELSRR